MTHSLSLSLSLACSLLVIQEFKELERQDDKQHTTVDDNLITEPLVVSQNDVCHFHYQTLKLLTVY